MHDANDLLQTIKRAAADAVEAGKPVAALFGTVVSAAPLKISVEQKMLLTDAQLVLTRNVTDHPIRVDGGNVQNFFYQGEPPKAAAQPVDPPHQHAIGTVMLTVHNALTAGEKVLLMREQGGQRFIVIDRVVGV